MAKQLLVIRHAKSDWGNADLRDFDRPLNKRGTAAAPEMAQRTVRHGISPQKIVSSPAMRAFTTAKHFAKAWQIGLDDIDQEPRIYEASANTLLSVINKFDNKFDIIALFGHNPGLTDLVNYFGGHIVNIPTCGVALVEFDVDDWAMLSGDLGKIIWYDYPKSGED